MIKGKPHWWKILFKEPASWLVLLSLLGMLGGFFVNSIFEKNDLERKDAIEKTEAISKEV